MPYELKGRNVLVTGGSRLGIFCSFATSICQSLILDLQRKSGLGELVCLRFAQEGCNVAVNYVSSEAQATELTKKVKEYGVNAVAIQGDMGIEADCVRTVENAASALGGLDIIIANAGFTRFSKFDDLSASTVEDWDKCFAVNVKAHVHLLRTALPIFTANADGGAYIITSSIAGQTPSGSSLPYSVTKAAQLHLMKCMAASQGPKVRVNAVAPGLLLTEWGQRYPEESIKMQIQKAALKKVTDLEDTAEAFIGIARNSSMTGQTITIDAGLLIGR